MPPPAAWVVSRVCDTFNCLPSAAVKELRRWPELVADVIELRAYAETRRQLLSAKDESDVPKGPMADLVADLEVEAMRSRGTGDDD